MIPLQLTLKNFLSYQEATLDFRGIHTACICGANGAGKSSLLEAITWAIWGKSRALNDDDVIHGGTNFVRVDFEFMNGQQTYRIIRQHSRGKSNQLEFQIKSDKHFRSLSGKGVKTTQAEINSILKIDYETFINSAYLRQGRADEFMLRKPSERKQILADLLKLDQYETLATQAKDLSKEFKGKVEQLESQIQHIREQLSQKTQLENDYQSLEEQRQNLQIQQDKDRQQLQQLQSREHQRQMWQQQLTWQQEQAQRIEQDIQQILLEKQTLHQQLSETETLLQQEAEIITEYQKLIQYQQEESQLSEKFQQHQEATRQKQELEQQLIQEINQLNLQLKQVQTQIESLETQEKDLQKILNNESEIKVGMEKLTAERQRLQQLDQLQHRVKPLQQRQEHLERQIEREKAQQEIKIEQIYQIIGDYEKNLAERPSLRQELSHINEQMQQLEKKATYQDRLLEKGQEKQHQLERIKAQQKIFLQQIEDLKQKLNLLERPESNCPLCEQSLDENHRHHVINKTNEQQQKLNEKLWILQEETTTFERELQVLRLEHEALEKELKNNAILQQRFNQIDAQLESMEALNLKLREMRKEIQHLEANLNQQNYALDIQQELATVKGQLQHLNYDEQTHALVRGQVEKLRRIEIRKAELDNAKRQWKNIQIEKPKLKGEMEQLTLNIQVLRNQSDLQRQIQELTQFLQTLNYDSTHHQTLSKALRTQGIWQIKNRDLQQAKKQYPSLQEKQVSLEQKYQAKLQEKEQVQQQLTTLQQQMEAFQDYRSMIQQLEEKIRQQRQKLDTFIAQKGKIEQSLQQIANQQQEFQDSQQQAKYLRQQVRVYQELSQAFGKNGIQALMIENILPQLEAESNHILSRLTNNQLHIQFVTQKSTRQRTRKTTGKLIDTLDILIADTQGTRAYETYSGGEAFRINFSIRLALAQLLAQRRGTALQMLIIDEGFGTQDGDGCERLIAAINAIASEFACILAITHMPRFKEAFQNRIEVRKTSQGSQLYFSS